MTKRLVAILFLCLLCDLVILSLASQSPSEKPTSSVSPSAPPAKKTIASPSLQDDIHENFTKSPATSLPRKRKKPTVAASKSSTKTEKTKSNNGKKPTSSVSSTASASLRRIKKEYKDAIQAGLCYDWVKGRLVTSSSKSSSSKSADVDTEESDSERQRLCLGPLATNLRHWHFSFCGVENSLYENGVYHGRILLPKNYPATPPRVQLWTPSGRFRPFMDICLSASAYHPETWTPRWTVLSLVQSLRLHMLANPTEIGGMVSSIDETLEHARESRAWTIKWKTSNKRTPFIQIDHGKMLEEGVLKVRQTEIEECKEEPTHVAQSIEHQQQQISLPSDVDINPIESKTNTRKRKKSKSKKMKSKIKTEKEKVFKQDDSPNSLRASERRRPTQKKKSLPGILGATISRLFATSTRIALVSLVLLLWILTIP